MNGIEIVVDELVVRGLSPSDARTMAATLESELTALAATRNSLPGRDEASRRPVDVSAGSPAGLGRAVAADVWRTLAGGDR